MNDFGRTKNKKEVYLLEGDANEEVTVLMIYDIVTGYSAERKGNKVGGTQQEKEAGAWAVALWLATEVFIDKEGILVLINHIYIIVQTILLLL